MKPMIVCKNFDPPEKLAQFMKEAMCEILRISPYESYLEAYIRKELSDYLMLISINYPEGEFFAKFRGADLRKLVTKTTADIFTQVRKWWKERFAGEDDERTDWAGDFDEELVVQDDKTPVIEIPRGLRVLVVDDDIESVTPLELCLEKLGCETFVVNNGFEAIHEIVSDNRVYDVVILDWSMPEMNGGQALLNAQRVIAHSPAAANHWEKSRLPVITFSSRALDEIEVPQCADFRHVAHWEKPASYLHLLNQATETFAKLR